MAWPLKLKSGIVQEMAEGDDDQDATERAQCVACAQAEDDERSRDEFYEGNGDADSPKRPDRQKSVAEREKIFSRVFERSQLKNFPEAGHEKDEAENETSEEDRPRRDLFCYPQIAQIFAD